MEVRNAGQPGKPEPDDIFTASAILRLRPAQRVEVTIECSGTGLENSRERPTEMGFTVIPEETMTTNEGESNA